MKKLSLSAVFEGMFHPEVPSPRNKHHTNNHNKTSADGFPFTNTKEPMYSEDEIDAELQLESGREQVGSNWRDPKNFPNKSSAGTVDSPTLSFPRKKGTNWMLGAQLKPTDKSEEATRDTNAKNISSVKDFVTDKDDYPVLADKIVKQQWTNEEIAAAEKGLHRGGQMSTMNPLESGIPKSTKDGETSEDEIDALLGFDVKTESLSLKRIFEWATDDHAKMTNSKIVRKGKEELDFFEKSGENVYLQNTEDDFNRNQRKKDEKYETPEEISEEEY